MSRAAPAQPPTATNLHVRTPMDAHLIFHAVHERIFPMVTRRPDGVERRAIRSGHVFVWQERESNASGIERWTDGRRWGPSRTKDDFLFYNEKDTLGDADVLQDANGMDVRVRAEPRRQDRLIKQTYSAYVETVRGRQKWHMIAYTSEASVRGLRTADDFPELRGLRVPAGKYRRARLAKGRSAHRAPTPPPAPAVAHWQPYQDASIAYNFNPHQHAQSYPSSPSSSSEGGGYPLRPVELYAPHQHQQGQMQNIPPAAAGWGFVPDAAKKLPPLVCSEENTRRHPFDEKALMAFRMHVD